MLFKIQAKFFAKLLFAVDYLLAGFMVPIPYFLFY
ncbi:hypothetical protein L683_09145 [Pseudomonas aeruginosa WC55]|nr:hypothetical protein L683_09145 [Pseudomonas aeruginosa WC55]